MASVQLLSGDIATVDDADLEAVARFTWYKNGKYAIANVRVCKGMWKQVSMHRMITGCEPGLQVDHIDGNGLNNSRSNLRFCTNKENGRNRLISKANKSGFKGVSLHKASNKWMASIKHEGKSRNLGYFPTPEQAHEAYKQAAIRLHGEFASY